MSVSVLQKWKLRLQEEDGKVKITLRVGGGAKCKFCLSESRSEIPTLILSVLPLSMPSQFPDRECHCLDHLTIIFMASVLVLFLSN